MADVALEGRLGRYGEGILKLKCDAGTCILKDVNMVGNPGKRVVDTVQAFAKELEAHADVTLSEMGAKKELLKSKMSRTKDILVQPWDEADKYLDDYINQLTNGGPPLDDTRNG